MPASQVARRENIEKINVCKLSLFLNDRWKKISFFLQSEADSAKPSTTMKT